MKLKSFEGFADHYFNLLVKYSILLVNFENIASNNIFAIWLDNWSLNMRFLLILGGFLYEKQKHFIWNAYKM